MCHKIENHPIPNTPQLYVNDLILVDPNRFESWDDADKALQEPDTDIIRVYVPMDLSSDLIMMRLERVYDLLGPVSWRNEAGYSTEVERIIRQLEIYDQARMSQDPGHVIEAAEQKHSPEGIRLAKDIVQYMEENEGGGETFPYDEIEMLKNEYGF